MHTSRRSVKWVASIVLMCAVAWPLASTTPTAKPEDVGFSAERLKRINQLVQRHIDAKTFSGAVTLVARQGRIAHHEAQGLMDLDTKKPMQKDAIFKIMSMTKPVVGVAILMLIEEGKVRLNDPLSRFIPELKGLKVAVAQPNQGPPRRHVPVNRDLGLERRVRHPFLGRSEGEDRRHPDDANGESGNPPRLRECGHARARGREPLEGNELSVPR